MRRIVLLALALVWPVVAQAQDFWANTLPTITGTDTLSTTLREKEGQPSRPARASEPGSGCSINALSRAEKDALYAEYGTVRREQGAAKADAWVKAKGRAIYDRMAAEGRC